MEVQQLAASRTASEAPQPAASFIHRPIVPVRHYCASPAPVRGLAVPRKKTWIVSPPHGYVARARSFAEAARILSHHQATDVMPFLFCCGQATEVALKAFLVLKGVQESTFSNNPGHDLTKAWALAVQHGAPISSTPPQWCTLINAEHSAPYASRYPRANRLMGLPDVTVALNGIDSLIEAVEKEVKQ